MENENENDSSVGIGSVGLAGVAAGVKVFL
jgi:hypothetical protein